MKNGTFVRHDTQCQEGCTFRSDSGMFQLIVPQAVLQDDYNNQINYFTRSETSTFCAGTDST